MLHSQPGSSSMNIYRQEFEFHSCLPTLAKNPHKMLPPTLARNPHATLPTILAKNLNAMLPNRYVSFARWGASRACIDNGMETTFCFSAPPTPNLFL